MLIISRDTGVSGLISCLRYAVFRYGETCCLRGIAMVLKRKWREVSKYIPLCERQGREIPELY